MSEQKSKEHEFTRHLKEEFEKSLSEYVVTSGECLIYKFLIDAQGQLQPETVQKPKRGQLAFQTDLMIKKANPKIPLVVIEVKFGHFTTHDVLTYSAKAVRHKEIYPYLRYGLIVGGVRKIDRRFFTHNSGFDFALAIGDLEDIPEATEAIRQQLHDAELMLTVLQGKEVRQYLANIEINMDSSVSRN